MDSFQSTLPQGERPIILPRGEVNNVFQSTLPQGERLRKRLAELRKAGISIHAPARGATFFHLPLSFLHRDFNPRSRKGSDPIKQKRRLNKIFQSTLPQGERPFAIRVYSGAFPISIHAPARGATKMALSAAVIPLLFQSTLPQGERPVGKVKSIDGDVFQSTLPQGERPAPGPWRPSALQFQSTLPQGERLDLIHVSGVINPFQSTLPQGERRYFTPKP